jgi:hypothetical protein
MELKQAGTSSLEPQFLRTLKVYGGQQGIWVDKKTTGPIALSANSICVSILHTGSHYPDDLSDDGVIYHYPNTGRAGRRDAAEIDATEACRLHLPIFVLLPLSTTKARHEVKLGWIIEWDDETQQFLILFSEAEPIVQPTPAADAPFTLIQSGSRGSATVATRPAQQRFRFAVLKQYGAKCAVCDVAETVLIVAAHICGKSDRGCDDWRNGLPLCATHHLAFDANMFAINPDSLKLVFDSAIKPDAVGINVIRLATRHGSPHPEALAWRFERFQRRRKPAFDEGVFVT